MYFYFGLCQVFTGCMGFSLVAASGGYSLLWCTGFSLQWLLLSWSTEFPDNSVGKNLPAMQESLVRFLGRFNSWVGRFLGQEIPWRRDRLSTSVFLGFPCGSADKESAHNAGDLGSIPGLGQSPGEEKGYPLQYSGLEKFMGS